MLNEAINETFSTIQHLKGDLAHDRQELQVSLSEDDFQSFNEKVKISTEKHFISVQRTQIRKFEQLINTPHQSFPAYNHPNTDKWLVNLTNISVPDEVQEVLKLGEKYSIPIPNQKIPMEDLISSIESSIYSLDDPIKIEIRNKVTNILTNFKNSPDKLTCSEVKFTHLHRNAILFLKANPSLLILTADKGNVTVIMNRDDYNQKVQALLGDTNTYTLQRRDPTASIQTKVNSYLSRMEKEQLIDPSDGKSLRSYVSTIPKLYALPKIHKAGTPVRPIVDCTSGPTFKLAGLFVKFLNPSVGKTDTWILNSLDFKEKISNVILPPDHVLISLDVVNLFTNIPNDLVLQLIDEKFDEIQEKALTLMPFEEFIEGLNLILSNCFFSFDNRIYKQIFGSPMGSPVSPVLANLVMEHVESSVLERLDFRPPFFFRYVDDIITAVPKSKVNSVLENFNSFHERIQFTLEMETDNSISFLDLKIHRRNDGTLITDWYHKATWSGRYMDFNSWLPSSYKRNTVTLLTDKIQKLSDKSFHEKNFSLMIDTLRNNHYPTDFILDNMQRRMSQEIQPQVVAPDTKPPSFMSIPYVKVLFEKLRKLMSLHNFRLVGRSSYPLKKSIFSKTKDPIPLPQQSNLVYEVKCECNMVYVGQTKQYLKKRMENHSKAIAKKDEGHSALATHAIQTRHKVDFQGVKVIGREKSFGKRFVLEMIEIRKRRPQALNKQVDSQNLGTSYDNLF
jgi:hypothetical protein